MLLLRDCHFYFVSERIPQPIPLSSSFRSTFLRRYLRHFRRRCSPHKLHLVILELAEILQKRDPHWISFIPSGSQTHRRSLQLRSEDQDTLRPMTPHGDMNSVLMSKSPSSPSSFERKLDGLELEMVESPHCLDSAMKNSNPSWKHNRVESDWLQRCVRHDPISRDLLLLEEKDPMWDCFCQGLTSRQVESSVSSRNTTREESYSHLDARLVLYERTMERLTAQQEEGVESVALTEPSQQEMEREITSEQNKTISTEEPLPSSSSSRQPSQHGCYCLPQFHRLYKNFLFGKSDNTTRQ